MRKDPLDPTGLIREAFNIDGISIGECRSIFLDWAMGVPVGIDAKVNVQKLLVQYAQEPAVHPMTLTLRQALEDSGPARRRGGRAGRIVD